VEMECCSVILETARHAVVFQNIGAGGIAHHIVTVPMSIGSIMDMGPMPDPMTEESTGRNKLPPEPLGRRL